MKKAASLANSESGATAVEFALLALPLLMLAFGVFEFGRYCWTAEALQESAVAGARCIGILGSSCASNGTYSAANTVTYVQGVASGWGFTVPSADIVTTNNATCGTLAGFAKVQITYTFQTVVPSLIPQWQNGASIVVQSCYPNNPQS